MSLRLTSQRVHGQIGSSGLFGGGRAVRKAQDTADALYRHVVEEIPASRLFNDVVLWHPVLNRKGQPRFDRNAPVAEHVLLCGNTVMVVASVEVPTNTCAWDGKTLRAGGRRIPVPQLSPLARQLRTTLTERVDALYGEKTRLSVAHQVLVFAPDRSPLSPVIEPRGQLAQESSPLAATRACQRIYQHLLAEPQANHVNRYVLAALREKLKNPEES